MELYSFIPNRRGSPFINFRPICHFPRPLFHIPRLLIFGRIAASPVYHMYSVNLMHIFGIGSRKFRMFDGESDRESESAKRKFVLSFQCSSYPTSSLPTPPLHQRPGASLSAASVSPPPASSLNLCHIVSVLELSHVVSPPPSPTPTSWCFTPRRPRLPPTRLFPPSVSHCFPFSPTHVSRH